MEERDIVINRLPARTWNRLGMNESVIKGVRIEGETDVKLTGIPFPGETAAGALPENFCEPDNVLTGAGAELSKTMNEACIPFRAYEIKENAKDPVRLSIEYRNGESTACRYGFFVPEGKNLDLVVDISAQKGVSGFGAAQILLFLGRESHVRMIQTARAGDSFTFVSDLGAVCGQKASLELIQISLGGKIYQSFNVDLKGDNSSLMADIGYELAGNDLLDMNAVVNHLGRMTTSTINASGSLSEASKKLFRGTIDLKKGCLGAVGNEKEDVLLLDDTVINQTIPLILCGEEDVEGNHGATIGRPDPEKLFYMTSRGLSEKEAIKLLKRARLQAVFSKLWDPLTKEMLTEGNDF